MSEARPPESMTGLGCGEGGGGDRTQRGDFARFIQSQAGWAWAPH